MSKDSKPERESHVAAGEAAGASADPWGYVWDPRGYYWHPLARHWYEPYSQVYYSEDGQVLPPEVAQAQLARAMGWEAPQTPAAEESRSPVETLPASEPPAEEAAVEEAPAEELAPAEPFEDPVEPAAMEPSAAEAAASSPEPAVAEEEVAFLDPAPVEEELPLDADDDLPVVKGGDRPFADLESDLLHDGPTVVGGADYEAQAILRSLGESADELEEEFFDDELETPEVEGEGDAALVGKEPGPAEPAAPAEEAVEFAPEPSAVGIDLEFAPEPSLIEAPIDLSPAPFEPDHSTPEPSGAGENLEFTVEPSAAEQPVALSSEPPGADQALDRPPPPSGGEPSFDFSPEPSAAGFEFSPEPSAFGEPFSFEPSAAGQPVELSSEPSAAGEAIGLPPPPPPAAGGPTFDFSAEPPAAGQSFDFSPEPSGAGQGFDFSPEPSAAGAPAFGGELSAAKPELPPPPPAGEPAIGSAPEPFDFSFEPSAAGEAIELPPPPPPLAAEGPAFDLSAEPSAAGQAFDFSSEPSAVEEAIDVDVELGIGEEAGGEPLAGQAPAPALPGPGPAGPAPAAAAAPRPPMAPPPLPGARPAPPPLPEPPPIPRPEKTLLERIPRGNESEPPAFDPSARAALFGSPEEFLDDPEAPFRLQENERAIIHLADGQVKRGILQAGSLFEPLRLQTAEGLQTYDPKRVHIVFLLRRPDAPPAPPPQGRLVQVHLPRGRSLTGYASENFSPKHGFFLTPRGTDNTTSRVFLYPWSVQRVVALPS